MNVAFQSFQQPFPKRGQADSGEFGKFMTTDVFQSIFTFHDSKSNQGKDYHTFNGCPHVVMRKGLIDAGPGQLSFLDQ